MTSPTPARFGMLEAALLRAAADHSFCADLKTRRSAAAREAGIELSPAASAMLDSIPADQLESLLASLPAGTLVPAPEYVAVTRGIRPDTPPEVRPLVKGIRPGIPAVAAGAVLLVGAGATMLLLTAGNRPDIPPLKAEPSDGGLDTMTADSEAKDGGGE